MLRIYLKIKKKIEKKHKTEEKIIKLLKHNLETAM